MRVHDKTIHMAIVAIGLSAAGLAHAADDTAPASAAIPYVDSGRLLLTQGVSNIEGAAGGGLASWAVISGYGTRDAVRGRAASRITAIANSQAK